MRASASDTELNRLDAASVGVQRFLSPGIGADAAAAARSTGSFFAAAASHTAAPRGAARAASQPPASAPDPRLRSAAARHAMSARLPDVRRFFFGGVKAIQG
jgi:hypothetical protein